ncbi:MAG: response regulator [Candidatus Omnitrophica bacterium]|nr:response regulator [Candidatus Omnitrophota bacterium]MBU1038156.1 response regulator [Candidatus Omnitrophota bacterium]MBU1808499.1 response regulator [Candidatus Omnitrophota bacterium]
MTRKRAILVVDDEVEFLKMIRLRLEANDYEVVTAINGAQAKEKLKSYKLDAVLLDIMLPDMNGIDILKTIRKTDKNMPVFMITAFSSPERFELANKFNASGFIVKTDDLQVEVNNITSAIRLADKFKG